MGRYFSIFDNIVLIKRKVYHHKQNNKTLTAVMYANTDTSELLSDGRLVSGSPVGGPTGRENINIFAGDRRTFANGGRASGGGLGFGELRWRRKDSPTAG